MGLFSRDTGFGKARAQLNKGRDAYLDEMRGIADTGYSAYETMAALLGVGNGNQQEALAAFQNTPGLQYAQQQMQDATQRQFSATGMNQSGNVLSALQERASNLSSQQFGTYLGQLGSVAAPGLQAKESIANMQMNFGQQMAGLEQMRASAKSDQVNAIGNLALNSALGGFGGMGGMGGLTSMFNSGSATGSLNAGSKSSGYTGNAFSSWLGG